jgi:CYTH domain-containing protein
MSVDGLTRDEKEWYISEDEYNHLSTKAEGKTISKTRYSIKHDDGLRYEYDIFHGELDGLAYLEIEFTDEQAARDFANPDYVIKDVTSDKRYKNQALAQYGIPQDN